MVEHKFPKEERLRSRRDFIEIFDKGKRIYSPHLILFCRVNGEGCTRLGITASRKVGSAVVRNRVKRHIREFYRQHKSYFITTLDYSLVVRESFTRLPQKVAFEQIKTLLQRSNADFARN